MRPALPVLLAMALIPSARTGEKPAGIQTFRLVENACEVGFDGTSTLDNFSGSTRALAGTLALRLEALDREATGTIRIDATALDTRNRDRDREMHQKHLETAKFPAITWTMEKAENVVWETPGRKGRFDMKGTLDLHGVKNALTIPVQGELRDGVLHATGEVRFRMTRFGIEPPSKFLVIRVGKEVRVWFDIQAKAE